MSTFETEQGDSVHCQELSSGQLNTGIFNLRESDITTSIFRYDQCFHIDDNGPIYLRTAKNDFVSLFGNISPAAGSISRMEPTPLITFRHDIISNAAIIGKSTWHKETRVTLVYFDVRGCEDILEHHEMTKRLSRVVPDDPDERVLLDIQTDVGQLRVFYITNYSFTRDSVTDIKPRFELEFSEPQPLSRYLRHIQMIVAFMSLVVGRHLSSSGIHISPLTRE